MHIKIYFKYISILFILFSTISFAQTDWVKWGKADYKYAMPDNGGHRNYSFDTENPTRFVLKSAVNAYWFFISDVDGDNCSFSPTCSHFWVESVEETNILQGTLMFFDRFTRDMDIYKKYNHYPRVKDGHFYDPPSLYALDKSKIKYIPPVSVVSN